jgi:hypothetical protein
MGTGVVPSATDDNPYLPYIRTTEEFGGLVACPWYPVVELPNSINRTHGYFSCSVYTIPINVLTCVTTILS